VNGVSGDGIAIQAPHKRLIDHDGDIARSHFNATEKSKVAFSLAFAVAQVYGAEIKFKLHLHRSTFVRDFVYS